nr:hypothetical protein [Tanacetum cinerariifolium]
MMVVKKVVNRLLEEVEVSPFGKRDDFGVDVLRFHTCLTDIIGFLEKLEWWFKQEIDDEEGWMKRMKIIERIGLCLWIHIPAVISVVFVIVFMDSHSYCN